KNNISEFGAQSFVYALQNCSHLNMMLLQFWSNDFDLIHQQNICREQKKIKRLVKKGLVIYH
ncbi:hypothetical protein ABPG73_008994, partial [Tetrahymena malaccensis]